MRLKNPLPLLAVKLINLICWEWRCKEMVICHKLVLKSVSYLKIVKNTPILINRAWLVMCTLNAHKVIYRWKAYIPWMSYMPT